MLTARTTSLLAAFGILISNVVADSEKAITLTGNAAKCVLHDNPQDEEAQRALGLAKSKLNE